MILITGDRQTGKTTKLLRMVLASAAERGGRGLVLFETFSEVNYADRIMIDLLGAAGRGQPTVVTKTWQQFPGLRGQRFAVVGVDEPARGWTRVGVGMLPIEYQTVVTLGPLAVIDTTTPMDNATSSREAER